MTLAKRLHTQKSKKKVRKVKKKSHLYDLVSQSEPSVACCQAVWMNVVDEDVGEPVLGVGLVAQGEAEALVGGLATQDDFLRSGRRSK